MSYVLEDLSQEAIIEAIEANLGTLARYLARSPRIALHDDADVTWYVSDVPFPLLNSVMSAKFEQEDADKRITEILGKFRAAGMPMLWWAGPASTPHDLGERLLSHGMIRADVVPGMAADLLKLDREEAPAGVIVKIVEDNSTLEQQLEVSGRGFGLPGFVVDAFKDVLQSESYDPSDEVCNYVAYLDGEPVGVATVVYGAGVAGIYNVTVVEEARGRGVGRAVTLAPLLDARDRGYRVGVLEASEMGYNIYKRLGFEEYGKIEQYFFRPDAA